jgi:CHASE3 domain sensor protein
LFVLFLLVIVLFFLLLLFFLFSVTLKINSMRKIKERQYHFPG